MWVNCVYCGHNYGPAKCSKCKGKGIIGDWRDADEMECSQCNGTGEDTPVAMADVLKEHIAVCPLHPMSKMREALEHIRTTARLAMHQPPHADLTNILADIITSTLEALK
jgi:hypothetical protein